jgi:hypothetical protein
MKQSRVEVGVDVKAISVQVRKSLGDSTSLTSKLSVGQSERSLWLNFHNIGEATPRSSVRQPNPASDPM